jgi:AmiS/UreI family transporter
VGGVQPGHQRQRPGVRLVLPVRGDHRDPGRIYTLQTAGGNPAGVWLGLNWFAWAVLCALFFVLLALERPIGLITRWVTIIEGIITAWALGFAVLIGALSF